MYATKKRSPQDNTYNYVNGVMIDRSTVNVGGNVTGTGVDSSVSSLQQIVYNWQALDQAIIDTDKLMHKNQSTSMPTPLVNEYFEIKTAVKEKNQNKLMNALKKMGQVGLDFFKDISANVIADLISKAIQG